MIARNYYLLPSSPLRTVLEVDAPSEHDNKGRGSPDPNSAWAPARVNRKPVNQDARRVGTGFTQRSSSLQQPPALFHHDGFLNQLYSEVWDLYKPGSLTGVRIVSRVSDPAERSTSLLRLLSPDHRVIPLSKGRSHSVLDLRSRLSRPTLRPRHSDSVLDTYEAMPPKRKAKSTGEAAPAAKRAVGRKDLLHDEKHVFSAKSKLANEDLVAFFADPTAWDSLADDEKETIRSLMPPDMVYNENNAPSADFLRYDNDWRNGVRLFTEDVQAGRYEPGWLEEAHEASQERRDGAFDQWKEQQFEEFWGQKSDAHADLMASEAIKIRLPEMIAAGLFKVGDEFSYARTFGKGQSGFLVEKNPTITKILGQTLTFAMAPGQQRNPSLKSLKLLSPPTPPPHGKSPKTMLSVFIPRTTNGQKKSPSSSSRSHSREAGQNSRLPTPKATTPKRSSSLQPPTPTRVSPAVSSRQSSVGSASQADEAPSEKKRFGFMKSMRRKTSGSNESLAQSSLDIRRKPIIKPAGKVDTTNQPTEAVFQVKEDDSDSPLSSLCDESELGSPGFTTTPGSRKSNENSSAGSPGLSAVMNHNDSPTSDKVMELLTIEGVDNLQLLEDKILEMDGRYKGDPRRLAWRTIRCKRAGKDLGTLWDMRETYYKKRYG